MNRMLGGIFNFADRLSMESLQHRLRRSEVEASNIANAETPGFRAIGYDFEEQLQSVARIDKKLRLKTEDDRHLRSNGVRADGKIDPDIFVRPTESIGDDGNTVDVDGEMARMAQNNLLYRSAVELINRKVGMLRYAINGGR